MKRLSIAVVLSALTASVWADAGMFVKMEPIRPCQKIQLFNGKDFSGWTKVITAEPNSSPDTTWQIADGVIRCTGKPFGYLTTNQSFADYKLTVEYRWSGEAEQMNSGIFVNKVGPDTFFLPRAIETQLKMGSAGDYVLLSKTSMNGIRNANIASIPKMKDSSEKPRGEWNKVEILVRGNTIESRVNGVLQNRGEKLTDSAGQICLQSEGGPIEFRNITLEPAK